MDNNSKGVGKWKGQLNESMLTKLLMLVLKFVDDTKVFRKVTNDTDKQSLHDNLDQLDKWSEKWQMLFNFEKCKYMHIGHRN